MTRAVVYARVSSDKQRERHTIGVQLRELPAHVKREGWTLVDTLVDDGISGETVEGRPGFLKVLELAEARAFDILVVIDLDRITRAKKSAEGALIFDTLRECKVRISVPHQGIVDLDDEDQDFFVSIRREMAKWEKRKILRRMMRGQREAARLGKRYHCKDPYGYQWKVDESLASGGRYVIREEEAAVVRKMADYALRGCGIAWIVWFLNQQGVRTRAGGDWAASSVRKVLRFSTIKGELLVQKKSSTPIVIPTEAILSAETWARVQAAIDGRRTEAKRPSLGVRLLSGIAKCGVCGCAMWISHPKADTHNGNSYYRCGTTNMWRKKGMTGPCGQKSHRADEIDAAVWDEIRRIFTSPKLLARACSIATKEEKAGVDWRSQLERCNERLLELEALEAEVLGRRRRGLISAGACDRELDSLARERGLVERNRGLAEAQLTGSNQTVARMADVAALARSLRSQFDCVTLEQRIALLRSVVKPPRGSVRIHKDGAIEIIGVLVTASGASVEAAFSVQARKHA